MCLYRPQLGQKRHILSVSRCNSSDRFQVEISTEELLDLTEVIDNSKIEYEMCIISGFTVNYEPGVFNKHSELRFEVEQALAEVL